MGPIQVDPITQMFIDNKDQRVTLALINGFNATIRAEMGKLIDAKAEVEAERDELRKQLDALTPAEPKAEERGGEENKDVA